MIFYLSILAIALILAIIFTPSLLASVGVHMLVRNFHQPSALWLAGNYIMGIGGIIAHIIINVNIDGPAQHFWLTFMAAITYGVVSIVIYMAAEALRENKVEKALGSLPYINPDEMYYLQPGETPEQAIDRLSDQITSWFDIILPQLKICNYKTEMAAGRLGLGFQMMSRARTVRYNPQAVQQVMDDMHRAAQTQDYIMGQIQIRLQLIFALMEANNYDRWPNAAEFRQPFVRIHSALSTFINMSATFCEIAHNIQDSFDQRGHSWAMEASQCIGAANGMLEAYRNSQSRVNWILENVDRVSQ